MSRHHWPEAWSTKALRAITQIAIRQQYLTADDLHDELQEEPKDLHEWGAVFDAAKTLGTIITTGRFVQSRRKAAKGRNVQLWESAYHRGPVADPDPVKSYLEQSRQPAQQTLI